MGGMSSLLGGGGGGGGGMGSLMSVGMKLLGSRGAGGGGSVAGLLGGLVQSSNSGGWKKQTPVLSSNEVSACPWSLILHCCFEGTAGFSLS